MSLSQQVHDPVFRASQPMLTVPRPFFALRIFSVDADGATAMAHSQWDQEVFLHRARETPGMSPQPGYVSRAHAHSNGSNHIEEIDLRDGSTGGGKVREDLKLHSFIFRTENDVQDLPWPTHCETDYEDPENPVDQSGLVDGVIAHPKPFAVRWG
ncbi:hypothetical protein EDD22DRAFT_1052503 [Suillus occidentalis]|nr:hypothetical protein EDD22DRAFT_1052503 [Suillus occidentalis]